MSEGVQRLLHGTGGPRDRTVMVSTVKNTLRWLAGEEQITHLGREYYE